MTVIKIFKPINFLDLRVFLGKANLIIGNEKFNTKNVAFNKLGGFPPVTI